MSNNNMRNGEYMIYDDTTGLISIKANYINGILHGDYEKYHSDTGTTMIKCAFANNMIHGLYEEYYKSGNLYRSVHMIDNVKDGKETIYYDTTDTGNDNTVKVKYFYQKGKYIGSNNNNHNIVYSAIVSIGMIAVSYAVFRR